MAAHRPSCFTAASVLASGGGAGGVGWLMSKHGLEKAIRVRANPRQKAPGSRTRRWIIRHSATDSLEGRGCGVIGKGKGLCLPALARIRRKQGCIKDIPRTVIGGS